MSTALAGSLYVRVTVLRRFFVNSPPHGLADKRNDSYNPTCLSSIRIAVKLLTSLLSMSCPVPI
ncbi:hypothetical protein M413DRAFT_437805 [Hebeloma cylindrosporum]|uniref:Uncharacterized protein n=1 Tax=Hebeloma cylindrosporum TaxID=76867 RepID=A0A0C2YFY0_HEBCY|nr:hypothetical protein M413DRAFT_437805 [Hebeloma cylindrosporum h7]